MKAATAIGIGAALVALALGATMEGSQLPAFCQERASESRRLEPSWKPEAGSWKREAGSASSVPFDSARFSDIEYVLLEKMFSGI